jgi:hypothetical protein
MRTPALSGYTVVRVRKNGGVLEGEVVETLEDVVAIFIVMTGFLNERSRLKTARRHEWRPHKNQSGCFLTYSVSANF